MIIGVLGGGQLARMLAMAGLPLGMRFVFFDPSPHPCAAPMGTHIRGAFTDYDALGDFAAQVDIVTYEFENIPLECLNFLSRRAEVRPGREALACARDRLREKQLFQILGIPTPVVVAVDSEADLRRGIEQTGLPAVLKTRTLGYDGKGQFVLRRQEDVTRAWLLLGGAPLVLESFVVFDREISILGARAADGDMAFYPVTENHHQEGILRFSRSCAGDPVQSQAEDMAGKILGHLAYVGVFALELFQVGDTLLANEMAPRVHNSGHWSIEGAETSQFENHLRAIGGLPLGSTAPTGHAAMVNFIGREPDVSRLLRLRGVHVHLYGKAHRPGRKVGHATLQSADPAVFRKGCKVLRSLV